MKKLHYRLFAALFLTICAIPTLATLLLGPSKPVANETPVPRPQLRQPDNSLNWAFLSDAGDWFAKHFAFRPQLITADSAWKAALLATSSQKQVALGQDGWLYYAETLDDYTGADAITPRQAFCCARSLKLVQDWAESQNTGFLFTVAPNKLSLYPGHFPGKLEKGAPTSAKLLATQLEAQGVAYADLFSALSSVDEALYHAADSHWNNRGAALAHDVLLENLGIGAAPAFEKPGHFEGSHQPDLYGMLYPASSWLDQQFIFDQPPAFTYDAPVQGPDDILIHTTGQGDYSLLMFRDSFGNALHSLLAESFAASTFTRSTPYDLSPAATVDFVILEIVERNISRLAQGGYLLPAPLVGFTPSGAEQEAPAVYTSQPVQSLPGYVQVTGALPFPCQANDRILLEAGGVYYEAFPTSGETEGFTAVLPKGIAPVSVVACP